MLVETCVIILFSYGAEHAEVIIQAAEVYHRWTAEGQNILVISNIRDVSYAHAELTLRSFTSEESDESMNFIETIQRRGQLYFLERAEDMPRISVRQMKFIGRRTDAGHLLFPDGTHMEVSV